MNWIHDPKMLTGRVPDDLAVNVLECQQCQCRNFQVVSLGSSAQPHLVCWRCDQVYCVHVCECEATGGDLNPLETDAVFNPPF